MQDIWLSCQITRSSMDPTQSVHAKMLPSSTLLLAGSNQITDREGPMEQTFRLVRGGLEKRDHSKSRALLYSLSNVQTESNSS